MSHASAFPMMAGAVLLLAVPAAAQDPTPRSHEEMHRLHQDPKAYIAMLEDPKRDEYQKPHEVLTALDLKPGGQIVMIDFQKRELPFGPPLAMKIAREDLVRQMEGNGFHLVKEHTFLPYQYFLVFEARG